MGGLVKLDSLIWLFSWENRLLGTRLIAFDRLETGPDDSGLKII